MSIIITHFAGEETEARSEVAWPRSIANKAEGGSGQASAPTSPVSGYRTAGQAGSEDGVHIAGWSPLAVPRHCKGTPLRAAGSGPALQRDHVEDAAGTGLPRERLGVTAGGLVSPLQGERMMGAVR